MPNNWKTPKLPQIASPSKTVRFAPKAPSAETLTWSFRHFDVYPWGAETHAFLGIASHLRDSELRPLKELLAGKERDHFIDFDRLCPDARKRLGDLDREHWAPLFSLHLDGKKRIWGVFHPDEGILTVLWWDPEHKVCPSEKKHT